MSPTLIIPSVGRIVHYVMPNGQHRPAIIVHVWHHPDAAPTPDSLVNLQVFVDGSNDMKPHPMDDRPSIITTLWKTSVHQEVEADLTPGSWHAPERVLEHSAELKPLEMHEAHVGMPVSQAKELHRLALALCHQIETCGASPELTRASVMASELRQELHKLAGE